MTQQTLGGKGVPSLGLTTWASLLCEVLSLQIFVFLGFWCFQRHVFNILPAVLIFGNSMIRLWSVDYHYWILMFLQTMFIKIYFSLWLFFSYSKLIQSVCLSIYLRHMIVPRSVYIFLYILLISLKYFIDPNEPFFSSKNVPCVGQVTLVLYWRTAWGKIWVNRSILLKIKLGVIDFSAIVSD